MLQTSFSSAGPNHKAGETHVPARQAGPHSLRTVPNTKAPEGRSPKPADNQGVSAWLTAKIAVGRRPPLCVTAWTWCRWLGYALCIGRLLRTRDTRLPRRGIVTKT